MKAIMLLASTNLEEKTEIISDFIAENDTSLQYAIEHKDRKLLEQIVRTWLQSETELSANN